MKLPDIIAQTLYNVVSNFLCEIVNSLRFVAVNFSLEITFKKRSLTVSNHMVCSREIIRPLHFACMISMVTWDVAPCCWNNRIMQTIFTILNPTDGDVNSIFIFEEVRGDQSPDKNTHKIKLKVVPNAFECSDPQQCCLWRKPARWKCAPSSNMIFSKIHHRVVECTRLNLRTHNGSRDLVLTESCKMFCKTSSKWFWKFLIVDCDDGLMWKNFHFHG